MDKNKIQLGDVVAVTIANKGTEIKTDITGVVDSVAIGLNGPDSRKITIAGLNAYIYLDETASITLVEAAD